MHDDAPTPRESGMHQRAPVFRALANELAARLDGLAARACELATADGARGSRARELAGVARYLVEAFSAWLRGEATYEQMEGDYAAWLELQAAARDLEAEMLRTRPPTGRPGA